MHNIKLGHVKSSMQKEAQTNVEFGHTGSSNSPGSRAKLLGVQSLNCSGSRTQLLGVESLNCSGLRTQLLGVENSNCSGSRAHNAWGRELTLLEVEN